MKISTLTFLDAGDTGLLSVGGDGGIVSWCVLRGPIFFSSGQCFPEMISGSEGRVIKGKSLRCDREVRLLIPDGLRHGEGWCRGMREGRGREREEGKGGGGGSSG
jgi:hypothetical protein